MTNTPARIESYWSVCFGWSTKSFMFALLAQSTLIKANPRSNDAISAPTPPQSAEGCLVIFRLAKARIDLDVRALLLPITPRATTDLNRGQTWVPTTFHRDPGRRDCASIFRHFPLDHACRDPRTQLPIYGSWSAAPQLRVCETDSCNI